MVNATMAYQSLHGWRCTGCVGVEHSIGGDPRDIHLRDIACTAQQGSAGQGYTGTVESTTACLAQVYHVHLQC